MNFLLIFLTFVGLFSFHFIRSIVGFSVYECFGIIGYLTFDFSVWFYDFHWVLKSFLEYSF